MRLKMLMQSLRGLFFAALSAIFSGVAIAGSSGVTLDSEAQGGSGSVLAGTGGITHGTGD